MQHHTIYIAKDYQRNLDEIDRLQVLSEDPSYYVQNAGITDSTLAPAGMSTLYVLVPVANQSSKIDWHSSLKRFTKRFRPELNLYLAR